jgi:hypothetical protein
MWRFILVAVGAFFALLSTGIAGKWMYLDNPLILVMPASVSWGAAVFRWRAHLALLSLGIALVLDGGIFSFVMPQVVNAGSGQDAVVLFATVAGEGTALVGLVLIAVGEIARRTRSQGP